MVPASGGMHGCARRHHHGGGLGGHRGRPPAVDRLQPDEGGGRGDSEHRRLDHVHRRDRPLHRARCHDDHRAPLDEQALPPGRRVRRPRHALWSGRRGRVIQGGVQDRGDGPVSTAVAIVLLVAIAAYAVFGGADFGAGFWDLTAGGPETGAAPRGVIERSIGPVWEANHVWLIFIFVFTWSAFPTAYESITLTMCVPLTIAALGIVLRGASFAFRKAVTTVRFRRIFGAGFALSSVLVPFCFGAIAGGIASGHVPAGGKAGDPVDSWLNPTSLVTGVLAIVLAAYLAAVYLVWNARQSGQADMAEYFRRRAVVTAVVAAVVAAIGFVVLHSRAP